MKVYRTKVRRLPGTSYGELIAQARRVYHIEEKRTKRQAYARSAYFKHDKVFLNQFWTHLNQKSQVDRKRRLYFYACALDLIRHSRIAPSSKPSPDKRGVTLHRFAGITQAGELFFVQISENKKGRKYFMSVFPSE